MNISEIFDKISNLITSLATALTAAVLICEAIKKKHAEDPILELKATYSNKIIRVFLTTRNRMAETLTITSISVTLPKGSLISTYERTTDSATGKVAWDKFQPSPVSVEIALPPAGTPARSGPVAALEQHGSSATTVFAVEPPDGWTSGRLRISVTASTNSDPSKSRRFSVSRTIQTAQSSAKLPTMIRKA